MNIAFFRWMVAKNWWLSTISFIAFFFLVYSFGNPDFAFRLKRFEVMCVIMTVLSGFVGFAVGANSNQQAKSIMWQRLFPSAKARVMHHYLYSFLFWVMFVVLPVLTVAAWLTNTLIETHSLLAIIQACVMYWASFSLAYVAGTMRTKQAFIMMSVAVWSTLTFLFSNEYPSLLFIAGIVIGAIALEFVQSPRVKKLIYSVFFALGFLFPVKGIVELGGHIYQSQFSAEATSENKPRRSIEFVAKNSNGSIKVNKRERNLQVYDLDFDFHIERFDWKFNPFTKRFISQPLLKNPASDDYDSSDFDLYTEQDKQQIELLLQDSTWENIPKISTWRQSNRISATTIVYSDKILTWKNGKAANIWTAPAGEKLSWSFKGKGVRYVMGTEKTMLVFNKDRTELQQTITLGSPVTYIVRDIISSKEELLDGFVAKGYKSQTVWPNAEYRWQVFTDSGQVFIFEQQGFNGQLRKVREAQYQSTFSSSVVKWFERLGTFSLKSFVYFELASLLMSLSLILIVCWYYRVDDYKLLVAKGIAVVLFGLPMLAALFIVFKPVNYRVVQTIENSRLQTV